MKRALIDPRQNRVAQVIDTASEREFSVAEPLFWMDAANAVTPETHFWNGNVIQPKPAPPPPPTPAERVENERRAAFNTGLLRVLAERFGVTEQALITEIKTKVQQ